MDIEIPHIQNDPNCPFTIPSIFICHWQTMKFDVQLRAKFKQLFFATCILI